MRKKEEIESEIELALGEKGTAEAQYKKYMNSKPITGKCININRLEPMKHAMNSIIDAQNLVRELEMELFEKYANTRKPGASLNNFRAGV